MFISLPHVFEAPNGADISSFAINPLAPGEVFETAPKDGRMDRHRQKIRLYQRLTSLDMTRTVVATDLAITHVPEDVVIELQRGIIKGVIGAVSRVTVAHIEQFVMHGDKDILEHVLMDAMDNLNSFQQALSIGVVGKPHDYIHSSQLPPAMPYLISGVSEPKWIAGGNFRAEGRIDEMRDMSPHAMLHIDAALERKKRVLDHGIFTSFADIEREAQVAYDKGNYLLSSTLIATATEVIIGEIIEMLMWEAGVSPADAISRMKDDGRYKSFSSLMSKELPILLGGGWDQEQSSSPAHSWRLKVANLRNKIVHQGYRPSHDEATASFNAFAGLMDEIERLLCQSPNDYPFTSICLYGEEFHRNGSIIRFTPITSFPAMMGDFKSWRAVIREVPPMKIDSDKELHKKYRHMAFRFRRMLGRAEELAAKTLEDKYGQ